MYGTHSYTEISLTALTDNYKRILSKAQAGNPSCRVAAVVKADAYGHGQTECAKVLYGAGCRFFVVATLDEAIALREQCGDTDCDLLVLQPIPLERTEEATDKGITLTVISPSHARELSLWAKRTGKSCRVHIKLNTGMNRLGFDARNGEKCAREIADSIGEGLIVTGIFSHLHAADVKELSDLQCLRFEDVCRHLSDLGIDCGIRHLSASEGFITSEKYLFDMIRAGISLYGYGTPDLSPVKRFCASVESISRVLEGDYIGYGTDTRAEKDSLIAAVSAGYADGLLRSCKGAYVAVETDHGLRPARIVGNVCMDIFMIDVSPDRLGANALPDGKVIIFGLSDKERQSLFSSLPEEMQGAAGLSSLASHAGTIEYELLVSTGKARGERIFKI